jgi:hypothetical protein
VHNTCTQTAKDERTRHFLAGQEEKQALHILSWLIKNNAQRKTDINIFP